jgi:hypothetical protein
MITRTIKQTGLALAVATFAFSTSCKKEKKEANIMPNGSYVVSDVRVMGMSADNAVTTMQTLLKTASNAFDIQQSRLDLDNIFGALQGNIIEPKTKAQKQFSYFVLAALREGFIEYQKVVSKGKYKDLYLNEKTLQTEAYWNEHPNEQYPDGFWLSYNKITSKYLTNDASLEQGVGALVGFAIGLDLTQTFLNAASMDVVDFQLKNGSFTITFQGGSKSYVNKQEFIEELRDVLIFVSAILDEAKLVNQLGVLFNNMNPVDINTPIDHWDSSNIPLLKVIANLMNPKQRSMMNDLLNFPLGTVRAITKPLGFIVPVFLAPLSAYEGYELVAQIHSSLLNINNTLEMVYPKLQNVIALARFDFTPTQVNVMTLSGASYTNMLSANMEWIDPSALHARMYYHFDTANPYKRVALRATFEPTANGYLMAPQDLEGGIMDIVSLLMNSIIGEKNITETRASQSRLNLGNLIQLELTKANN